MRSCKTSSTGKVVIKEGTKINPAIANKLAKDGLKNIILDPDNLIGKLLAEDIINSKSGEIYFEASDEITPEILEKIDELGLKNIHILNKVKQQQK